MEEIKPNAVYTTEEARDILRVSNSTIKRFLKHGVIKANKVGRQYRILGHEILRAISPRLDTKATRAYQTLRQKTKEKMKDW